MSLLALHTTPLWKSELEKWKRKDEWTEVINHRLCEYAHAKFAENDLAMDIGYTETYYRHMHTYAAINIVRYIAEALAVLCLTYFISSDSSTRHKRHLNRNEATLILFKKADVKNL